MFKFLLVAAVAVCTTACSLDELNDNGQSSGNKNEEVGYLSLGEVLVNDDAETANLNSQSSHSATRAKSEATGEYWIEVIRKDSDGTPKWKGTYADAKANPIPLEPATYIVYAYQDEEKVPEANVAEDAPYYVGKSEEVKIETKKASSTTVTCKLANIKTTVELSADLKKVFALDLEDNPLQTVVSVGTNDENKNSYTYPYTSTHENGPNVYFLDVAGPNSQVGNTMTIVLSGRYFTGDPDDVASSADASLWKDVTMTKTLTNVRAAEWRKISIDIDHNTTGTVKFVFKVSNVVYDDEVNVDVQTLYASLNVEDTITDDDIENPLAPSVTIQGNAGGNLNYAINGTMYDDLDKTWSSKLDVTITPTEGSTISEVYAVVASDNDKVVPALIAAGFADARVNIFPTNAAATYCAVADDGSRVKLNDAAMTALYKYAGTHTISVYTVDSQKRKKHTDIVVTVSNSGGPVTTDPSIVWVGYDIDEWQVLNSSNLNTFTAQIEVNSSSNFASFKVDIKGAALVDLLPTVGFPATGMELTNPTSAQMETNLRTFGFLPIEEGKTAADDDIYRLWLPTSDDGFSGTRKENVTSPLLEMKSISLEINSTLLQLLHSTIVSSTIEDKTCQFILTVKNADGSSTTKSIMIKCE